MKNKLAPFNRKVINYIKASFEPNTWLNVAEGGKRAGKNVSNVVAFCLAIDYSPDRFHLVSGVTVGTAIQNVIECNGYGVLNFFTGRIKKQKIDERLSYRLTDTKGREKIIVVVGGGKKGDEHKIRGNSYGCAYLTEANLLYVNFIKESFDRTITSKYRKIFLDLNPMWDGHWFYDEILGAYSGINYCHYVITDNNSITDDEIRERLGTYNQNTIWFKRDILGQRIASEGVIFRQVNERPAEFIATKEQVKKCEKVIIGLDFGGSKSKTAIVACGFYDKTIVVLKSTLIPVNSEINLIAQKLNEFIIELKQMTGAKLVSVQADYENQIAILSLRKLGIELPILNCTKSTIRNRITLKETMLNTGRYFFYLPDANNAFLSTQKQLWSEKGKNDKDERLDDGTIDIDTADAEEYCWTSIAKLFL